MKRIVLVLLSIALLLLASHTGADAKIRVVTTIPDLADMARNIGGDLLEIKSLATGVEDIHAVPMKPSFAVLLNRADVLFVMGLEVEHAFLPGLLEAARNPKILRDAPGYIDCSVYVTPLEVPKRLDRALGDVHPMGNPHINLDPVAGKAMARAMADGLAHNYPEHEATFKKNLVAYLVTLDAAIARWQREAVPLRGVKFISYHPDMIYFAERFGMEPAGTIERRAGVKLVVRERHYPAGLAETIAQRTGSKLVELPAMVGGVPEAKDYLSFIDYNIRTMLKGVQGG